MQRTVKIMWQCPKCNREFRNTNQDHYCGKIETIDQYILDQADEVQPVLNKIREVIREAAPDATEKI
jgi:transposase-like protein